MGKQVAQRLGAALVTHPTRSRQAPAAGIDRQDEWKTRFEVKLAD